MKHGMLKDEDWAEFEQKYAPAYNWMLARSLRRELDYLRDYNKNHPKLMNDWKKNRLKELETLIAEIDERQKKKAKKGDSVTVSDPKHDDSLFAHSFNGTVVRVVEGGYEVEDAEGSVFSVSADEIESVNT